jgi:type 1 glutamine amidotransferase
MRSLVVRSATALVGVACAVVLVASLRGDDKLDQMVEKVTKALPEKAPATPKAKRKILIYSKTGGFRHSSIALGAKTIILMGDKTGAYTAHHTEDESFFEPEKLNTFDAVFMLNTTGDCLLPKFEKGDKEAEKAARERETMLKKSLVDFVSSGKGLIGVHSATDTYGGWKEYNQMMGGTFAGHPWNQAVFIKNLEPKNPVNAAFEDKDLEVADEIYQFRADTALPTDRKFLLALDPEKFKDISKGNRKDGLYPISWIASYGKGRTFYCSLGHREEIFWNPTILKHYLAGIQYALGDLEADATPTKASDAK